MKGFDRPLKNTVSNLVRDAVIQEAEIVLPNGEHRGIGHGPVIVFRHGETRWRKAVRELDSYPRLVRGKSYRHGCITPKSCRGNGWSQITELVRRIETEGR